MIRIDSMREVLTFLVIVVDMQDGFLWSTNAFDYRQGSIEECIKRQNYYHPARYKVITAVRADMEYDIGYI